jgi:hypothetical protein
MYTHVIMSCDVIQSYGAAEQRRPQSVSFGIKINAMASARRADNPPYMWSRLYGPLHLPHKGQLAGLPIQQTTKKKEPAPARELAMALREQ